jgi:DNA polymerase III alpha subunit (gram-positive type)
LIKTVVVDLETTNLRSDIGTLIVACFGEMDTDGNVTTLETRDILDIGKGSVAQRERKLVLWAIEQWSNADIIIGQNHKAFDQKFLQGVMLRHGIMDGILPKRILIDTYQTGKGSFGMGMSMGNVVDVLGIGKKDAPEKGDWREANTGDPEALARIRTRCESDVVMTGEMWRRLKPTYMVKYGR